MVRVSNSANKAASPKVIKMSTKERLAARPRPDSYFREDISIKVRRTLVRRRSFLPRAVSAVAYSREGVLSPLYKKEIDDQYINQVFTVGSKIGQGCFGDVFRALSKEDSQYYAIKMTNDTHTFMDKGEVRRLEKILPHENCVRFFGAWQENFRLYIQMELCLASLDQFLLVYRCIDERRSWEIFVDIALGLQHLHSLELIHLDLKPANVMISSNGICKLGDFGLVVDLVEMNATPNKRPVFTTVSEGDGKYVALEVLNKIYSKAADIFSLGLLMLETITDVALPKSGPHWVEIRNGAVPSCYDECDVSSDFRQLLKRMLLKDYLLRPNVAEVLQTSSAVEILNLRSMGTRLNIMVSWDHDYNQYLDNNPSDIPCIQVDGPSPPRRLYPINLVPPLDPARVPLREITLDAPNQQLVEPENPLARVSSVSRRLF